MEALRLLAVLVLGPVIYFAVGLPWASLTRRLGWAPLWGIGVVGLAAEFGAMAGASVATAVFVLGSAHAVIGVWRVWRDDDLRSAWASEFAGFLRLYAMALLPLTVAPFALPGGWGGDWLVALRSGESLWHGTPFTADLLARPPLFGAASIPTLWFGSVMGGFQVFCAVASACALQMFREGMKPEARRHLLWLLVGSIFFLQISANAWPKFLCVAFLFAAWHALENGADRRLGVAGIMLGLALATHHSAVLFVPLLLTRLPFRERGVRSWMGEAGRLLALAALIVLPWEVYTTATYGWAEKIQANPAVSQRIGDLPQWLNVALVGVTTAVAWSPLEILAHWAAAPDRFSSVRVTHDLYWLVTETFNGCAGTLLGLVFPWWVAMGTRAFGGVLRELWRALSWPVRGALALALAGQMILNPFYSSAGTLQTGCVPLGMALVLWLVRRMADGSVEREREVLQRVLWLNTGPWVTFNLVLTAALALSGKFRGVFADGDLRALDARGWVSLGMGGFPWVQALTLSVLVLTRTSAAAEADIPARMKADPQPL